MAYIKTKPFKGYSAKYWNITTVQDNKANGTTTVILSLFKDRATRNADPSATLETYYYTLPGIDIKRAEIYPLLKTTLHDGADKNSVPIMADATDDLE